MLGRWDGARLELEELHRFANEPVCLGGTLHWDILRLLHEIKQGLRAAARLGVEIHSIGIDTWGVDFGLLDGQGRLMENPVHYRDASYRGMIEQAAQHIPLDELYDVTGIQFLEFNTVFQLLAFKQQRRAFLERAAQLLFLPDLLGYFLTGQMATEYSNATTSQLLDVRKRTWSNRILDALGLPKGILGEITPPGTRLGALLPEIQQECGLPAVPVISVCGHDTQSAIAAVPCPSGDFAFISSGTWSLFGTELRAPLCSETTRRLNIANEGGYDGRIHLLKNITGLWLIQESRRHWLAHPEQALFHSEAERTTRFTFAELEQLARDAAPSPARVNPDDPAFIPPGEMPAKVQAACRAAGYPVPQTVGEILRCIYTSLAETYRDTLQKISDCTGKTYPELHIIGGGVRDTLLCQMTADACGVPVKAGPVEATVLGNLAVQLLAAGDLDNLEQARQVIATDGICAVYLPG
jgi:rhamnulokinase/L-fuculokinase